MADLVLRKLSSTTKAVVVAFTNDPDWMKICKEERVSLAAAFRAAVEKIQLPLPQAVTGTEVTFWEGHEEATEKLLAIADELEVQ